MKHGILSLVTVLLVLTGCTREEPVLPQASPAGPELTEAQRDIIRYFKEVALGFEHGNAAKITRKWNAPMRMAIEGDPAPEVLAMVYQTIDSINHYATDGFSIAVVDNSAHDCLLFFGTKAAFVARFPDTEDLIGSNLAIFQVWWVNNQINRARIFIDTERPTLVQQQSLVKEEITQALGLGNDSPRYPESIFFETRTQGGFATAYAEIDKALIRLLYHPEMETGLDAQAVDARLRAILTSE